MKKSKSKKPRLLKILEKEKGLLSKKEIKIQAKKLVSFLKKHKSGDLGLVNEWVESKDFVGEDVIAILSEAEKIKW